ncbi:DNA polymerase subunit gamma-2, mitochondrial-like [Amphiura filiformis]|uniref:DNA polymerase subunit gamma-2, mitochondrial-like n=1 Tax=Amphiura filiformis TaxID=82378 RepID=UPI003B2262FB
MAAENTIFQKVISLCSRHSYIFKAQQRCASGLYELGPLGMELKHNICTEWWYSMVTSQGNVYGVECPSINRELQHRHFTKTTGNATNDANTEHENESCRQEEDDHLYSVPSSVFRTSLYQGTLLQYLHIKDLANKQLPFGTAQKGTCFRHRREQGADRFIFDTQEFTQLSVQYYCFPNTAAQQLDSWQRQRLDWWRKFAENPSNFTATDIQTKDQVQTLDIQYKFPWGPDTIERIYNRGQLPMDELLRWMNEGEVDCKRRVDAAGIDQGSAKDGGKKDLVDMLKARHGRKQTLPHTIEMTTCVESGMLAYLLDGFSEKQDVAQSTQKSPPKGPLQVMTFHSKLAPIKVAIVIKGSAARALQEISQYLQGEFRKSNMNVIEMDRTLTLQQMYRRADAMGVLFTIFVHEDTVKDGTIGIRSLGEAIVQGQHITQVKEFVLRHINHE